MRPWCHCHLVADCTCCTWPRPYKFLAAAYLPAAASALPVAKMLPCYPSLPVVNWASGRCRMANLLTRWATPTLGPASRANRA